MINASWYKWSAIGASHGVLEFDDDALKDIASVSQDRVEIGNAITAQRDAPFTRPAGASLADCPGISNYRRLIVPERHSLSPSTCLIAERSC